MTDLLSQAKATIAHLLTFASPDQAMDPMFALAAKPGSDELQGFGDSTMDATDEAQVERFCKRIAERTGGEFVLVAPGLEPVEHILLAHYSGGTGVGGAMALINRQPGQAPTLSEWVEELPPPGAGERMV